MIRKSPTWMTNGASECTVAPGLRLRVLPILMAADVEPVSDPMTWGTPSTSNMPLATLTDDVPGRVFAPESVNVPVPILVRPPVPETTPA